MRYADHTEQFPGEHAEETSGRGRRGRGRFGRGFGPEAGEHPGAGRGRREGGGRGEFEGGFPGGFEGRFPGGPDAPGSEDFGREEFGREGFGPGGRPGRPGHPGRPGRGGFGPMGTGPFGPMGPGRFGPQGRGRRGRAKRGDVRQAILALLAEGSANGYGLIKSIEERTGGVWRTSPGSMYPTLAQLVDEGLIAPVEGSSGGGTEYALTEAGGTYVTEHREELDKVWAPAEEEFAEVRDLMVAGRKLFEAARQVGMNGTPEQRTQAASKMDDLRKELYRILGE